MEEPVLPAFSWPTRPEDQPDISPVAWRDITPEWAWGGSTGKGVKVCIVDSGVEADHPALEGAVKGGVVVQRSPDGVVVREEPHEDLFGHGTACAGIIHSLAPEAEIYSARVLGQNLKGGGDALVAGVRWAVENGMDVINLSLSTRKYEHVVALHDLADEAYFRGTVIVAAANNMPVNSYPWLFASVISVASHAEPDPYTFYYNPNPPVEFTAPGVDLELAWAGKTTSVGTGNSYATPHIVGIAALIQGKHRLAPFHLKTVLYYTSKNVREALGGRP
ncbi:MAG TPA: S8 family serine peptidase [Chloroflexota bacterium]|nr:S8 family serine peptidase [Chloroflexota bacterium]